MSENDSPAGSPPQTLHEEETREEPNGGELGDYDLNKAGDSDRNDSDDDLSEIDEDQFGDYDPSAARIEEKPVDIDEDVARTLKAGKRKGQAVKKVKEARRPKKKRDRDDEDDGGDGEIMDGKRSRKAPPSSKKPSPEPIDESTLTPEERRQRAIERAAAGEIKNKVKKRKKKDEVDLENELDEHIAEIKRAMEKACEADNVARQQGQPAIHKLKLLPDVMALLNRNNNQAAIVDPDANLLEPVKFFLEPLSDGSLPAYNIQRDIFSALIRLPIDKEALRLSGIGKVVLFYTKSRKAEVSIKRMAEKLLGEWSRPILKRTHDYRQRHVETRDFDYSAAKLRQAQVSSQFTLTHHPAASQGVAGRNSEQGATRARVVGLPSSYTIAPKSTFEPTRDGSHRPIGASGIEAFRKMTQKGKRQA